MWVKFKQLSEFAIIPTRADEGSAGYDLSYPAEPGSELIIEPGETKVVSCGFAIQITRPYQMDSDDCDVNFNFYQLEQWLPTGFQIEIRPRSGMAAKSSISVLNTPGTIDESYRQEIKVILHNHSKLPYTIHPSDRIAQMVLMPYYSIQFELVGKLDETTRKGGLGSTGR